MRGPDRWEPRERGPGPDRGWRSDDDRVPANRFASRRWDGDRYRWAAPAYAPIRDCPAGFARFRDGCVVPADARRLDPARGWADWYPARYQDDGYDWRYDDGYLYGVDRGVGGNGLLGNGGGGLLAAIVPLLGGALFGGNLWPQQATDYQVPDYYDRFYGDDGGGGGRYDYRYADDAVFAVDPQSQRITSIAGLLTGDSWSIGQRMPTGYDLYNIPPQYRARYPDGADAIYRYSDGYVYQVDPRTRLVRGVTELLG